MRSVRHEQLLALQQNRRHVRLPVPEATTPLCNGSGTCVECIGNGDCDTAACEVCTNNVCESGCSGETPVCNGTGTCICNDTSCVGGCCNGSTCVPYAKQSDGTCGASGTCAPCDTDNCLHCNTTDGTCESCAPGETCVGGTCQPNCGTNPPCGTGFTCCSGVCTEDSTFCGASCNACAPGQHCCGDTCISDDVCCDDGSCSAGRTCCGIGCVVTDQTCCEATQGCAPGGFGTCCNGLLCLETPTAGFRCVLECPAPPNNPDVCEARYGRGTMTCDDSIFCAGKKCCRPKEFCDPDGLCPNGRNASPGCLLPGCGPSRSDLRSTDKVCELLVTSGAPSAPVGVGRSQTELYALRERVEEPAGTEDPRRFVRSDHRERWGGLAA